MENENYIVFIIWLIGTFISLYITCKYVQPHEFIKEILNKYKNEKSKCIDLIICIIIFVITVFSYMMLSWLGALATYLLFNNVMENN